MGQVGRTARADAQLAEFPGIPLHNPFIDSRVIDVSLSIPLDQRPGPADYKLILRESVHDLLPTILAARTTKGDATADRYHGLRAKAWEPSWGVQEVPAGRARLPRVPR